MFPKLAVSSSESEFAGGHLAPMAYSYSSTVQSSQSGEGSFDSTKDIRLSAAHWKNLYATHGAHYCPVGNIKPGGRYPEQTKAPFLPIFLSSNTS